MTSPLRTSGFRAAVLTLALVAVASAQQAPASFDSLAAAAAGARDQNNLPRAVALYRQALALEPSWPDGWWYLGLLGYSANDYASARDALTHYLQLMPSAGPAFALRGLCEFETADYTPSLADIERSISLGAANDPRNQQILRFHEALLLAHASRFEEALSIYQLLARTAPPNPDLLTAIGLAGLRNAALPNEASSSQQEIAIAAGQAAWPFIAGDRDAAAKAFAYFFTRFPTASNAHYFYAYLLFVHDPEAAVQQLDEELGLDADNVPALTLMAWSDILGNNSAAALPFARRAERLDSSFFMTQLVLGRSLVGTGDLGDGLNHLQQALQIQPNNVEVHIGLAIGYSKSGDRDLAHAERLKCLAMTKQDSVFGQQ
jgi:cytochrome c-type biogenesis protein CcmH/NrfG